MVLYRASPSPEELEERSSARSARVIERTAAALIGATALLSWGIAVRGLKLACYVLDGGFALKPLLPYLASPVVDTWIWITLASATGILMLAAEMAEGILGSEYILGEYKFIFKGADERFNENGIELRTLAFFELFNGFAVG